ncbi:MAG: LysR family transcriptional regulator [Eubacteriaceae bacterium]
MRTEQMECFAAVAETGSISAAARKLNISQPPLSAAMKKMEEEIGTRLFERGPRHITLTPAGSVFYKRVQAILEMTDSAVREAAEISSRRLLRFGITPTSTPALIPYFKRYCDLHPDVRFEIYDGSSLTLREQLLQGRFDLCTLRTPIPLNGICSRVFRREGMIAAALPGFLDSDDDLDGESLSRYPLIIYRRYDELIRSALRNNSFLITAECDDARTVLMMAREGIGVAVFPDSMLPLTDGLEVRRINEKTLETDILLAWRSGSLNAPLREFLDLVS